MAWTAQTFLKRVLAPRNQPPWWAHLLGEERQGRLPGRYLRNTLDADLLGDIPDYRGPERLLFFFGGARGRRPIDGRAGLVGVEEKCTKLDFDGIRDGAMHRGILWVIGNPYGLPSPEAVSLYVVMPGAAPMAP